MKKGLLLSLAALLLSAASAQKYVGGDISMLTKYEEAGVVYKDQNGKAVQPLTFFKEQGLNAMRVRLFVDPSQDDDKATFTIAIHGQTLPSNGLLTHGKVSTTNSCATRFTNIPRNVSAK